MPYAVPLLLLLFTRLHPLQLRLHALDGTRTRVALRTSSSPYWTASRKTKNWEAVAHTLLLNLQVKSPPTVCILVIKGQAVIFHVDFIITVICVLDIEPKAATACVTPSVKTQKDSDRVTVKGSQVPRTPLQLPISRPVSQTEPRAGHSSR